MASRANWLGNAIRSQARTAAAGRRVIGVALVGFIDPRLVDQASGRGRRQSLADYVVESGRSMAVASHRRSSSRGIGDIETVVPLRSTD